MIAEFVREAALEGVRDELPHSLAVVVEEHRRGQDPQDPTPRSSWSARPRRRSSSGAAGSRLKDVGTAARTQIEALLGTRVHLELFVKVAKDWQRDPRQLRRLGF